MAFFLHLFAVQIYIFKGFREYLDDGIVYLLIILTFKVFKSCKIQDHFNLSSFEHEIAIPFQH